MARVRVRRLKPGVESKLALRQQRRMQKQQLHSQRIAQKQANRMARFGLPAAQNAVLAPSIAAPGASGVCGTTSREGWIIPLLTKMAESGVVVMPTKTCRAVTTVGSTYLAIRSGAELLEAARRAVQGDSTKDIKVGQYLAAGGDVALAMGSNKTAGYIIRIGASQQNSVHGPLKVTVGARQTIYVTPDEDVAEFVVLAVSDNAGLGQLIADMSVTLTLVETGSALSKGNYWFSAESINCRDFGS